MTPKEAVIRTIPLAEQVDVLAGKCTYGQMVELSRLLVEVEGADVAVVKSLIRILHHNPDDGVICEPAINITNAKYARTIAEGVRFWREQEDAKLKYTPTAEEKQAGYEALSNATGPTGVASTIAEKFGVSGGPDEVFKWPYASVFMVLYIDLERYKFQRRLHDVHEAKRKRDGKTHRISR